MRALLAIGLLAAAAMSALTHDAEKSDRSDGSDMSDLSDPSAHCTQIAPSRAPVIRPVPPAPARSPDDDDFRRLPPTADPDVDRQPDPPASRPRSPPHDGPDCPDCERYQLDGPTVDAGPRHRDLGSCADLVVDTPVPPPPRATGRWELRRSGLFGGRVTRVWVPARCGPGGCR
jgi:hypothetical protein